MDEPVAVPNEERLEDWVRTPEGRDLLHLLSQLKGKPGRGPQLPHILKHLSNAALGVLEYVKS